MTLPRHSARLVFAVGALLRLYLAVVNTEANDDHLSVITVIAREHRLPRLREAWEGFQPKLYHATVAVLWNLSPWRSRGARVRIAQLVACAAGILTLLVVRRALRRRGLSPPVELLAFAFVALNPTLIGLDAQATNDAFVILFSTVALAAGVEFFRSGGRRAFAIMTGAVALAVLSKGNALVVFLAIALVIAHGWLRHAPVAGLPRRRLAGLTAAFVGVVAATAIALGPYRANWQDTGDPFAINGDRAPFPHLFRRTYVYRPGTTSIADTYFTFRLADMLRHPVITNDPTDYPLHRTSLWSQLYGRAHFLHFAQHPPSWRNTGPIVLTVGRLILVLALLPTALLLAGLGRAIVAVMVPRRGRARPDVPWDGGAELLTLTAVGFLAFIVMYTLSYRDFSTMKAEFLFPGLLAYATLFADETARAARRWASRPRLLAAAGWAMALLLLLYAADVGLLAVQLT